MREKCCENLECRPEDLRCALAIHTRKITDSCRDKDCIEDLRVYLTRESQAVLDAAGGAKVRSAELIYTAIDVSPVAFHRNHYTIDLTFYYKIIADAAVAPCRPAAICGLALFSKRAVLCGENSGAHIFRSDRPGIIDNSLPTAVVESMDTNPLWCKRPESQKSRLSPREGRDFWILLTISTNTIIMYSNDSVYFVESSKKANRRCEMTKKKGTRPAAGKKFPLGILLAAGAALVILAAALWPKGDDFPRLEVAGFRISREEYVRAMYQARNDVLSDHAAAGISLTDWQEETALGDPCELITERALEILKEYYAVGTLAVERGYLEDAGYETLLRDVEQINRQRQEALESGQIMTGMIQFSTEDYISYRASAIRLEFTNDPENPEYPVTEQALLDRYEADREDLYRQPDELELAFLLVDAYDWEVESLRRSFEALEQQARNLGSLAAALEAVPEMQAYYQRITVDTGTYSIYTRSYGDVLNWSANLQTGELSGVICQENRLCLIECLVRTEHQFRPLAEVESLVTQSIRESRYDGLIRERMEEMELRGDLDGLFRFTAEQLA